MDYVIVMQIVETAGDADQLKAFSQYRIGLPVRYNEPVAVDPLRDVPSHTPVCFHASSIETQRKTRAGSAPRLQ